MPKYIYQSKCPEVKIHISHTTTGKAEKLKFNLSVSQH